MLGRLYVLVVEYDHSDYAGRAVLQAELTTLQGGLDELELRCLGLGELLETERHQPGADRDRAGCVRLRRVLTR